MKSSHWSMPHSLTSKVRWVYPPVFYIHVLSILMLSKGFLCITWIDRSLDCYQIMTLCIGHLRVVCKQPCLQTLCGYMDSGRVKAQRNSVIFPEQKHCQVISHARLKMFYTAQYLPVNQLMCISCFQSDLLLYPLVYSSTEKYRVN